MAVQKRLTDQVAVITGASKGIGRASAIALAREGANIIGIARTASKLEELGREIAEFDVGYDYIVGDVSKPESAQAAVNLAVDKYGRIDILLNNAGIGNYSTLLDSTLEDYDTLMNTNMRSTFIFTRAVVPIMKEAGRGLILQISSQAGLRGFPSEAIYCATKHAQVGFTNALRLELQPFGVKVSVICPAGVTTDFAIGKGRDEAFLAKAGFLDAEDVADAVVLAATQSPRARMTQVSLISINEAL